VNTPVATAGVSLPGLSPGTTYHYRFVAQSGGGGPVFGPGKAETATFALGKEGSFTTPALSSEVADDCANRAFRTGPGSALPDCRAYEMVTPLEKGGGDILVLSSRDGFPGGLEQSSISGGQLAYGTYRAFGDSPSAPYVVEYVASREEWGWSSQGISPPREGASLLTGKQFELGVKALSPDLCEAWHLQSTEPVLESGVPAGFSNLYREGRCGGSGFGAQIQVAPAHQGESGFVFEPELQGTSADGECSVFRANDRLNPEAVNSNTIFQVYERCGTTLRLISVLPSGTANGTSASAGASNSKIFTDRRGSVRDAVSDDGSRVFWTAAETGPGALYLRLNADQPQSAIGGGGECTEPTKACTLAISAEVSANPAQFLGASRDGSIALFTIGEALYEFDLQETLEDEEPPELIAGGVKGIMGASEDAARVYLVSSEALAPGAVNGKANLYLYEAGSFDFLGQVSSTDAVSNAVAFPTPVARNVQFHTSRVSADGARLAFMSNSAVLSEAVANYDNTDVNSEEPDGEIYVYDATTDELSCVSCNPTGARPEGRRLPAEGNESIYWAAAQIPGWETQLYPSRVLSEDGSRLFFESFEALVPRDTNGKQDVYEWSASGNAAQCASMAATIFVPSANGCLSLISSGQSSEVSEFVDASPSGSDVFIRTGESLLAHDPGLIDIYDARVLGGFPSPAGPAPECEGEACQSPAAPPQDPTPASATFQGPASRTEAKPRPRCPKGKREVRKNGKTRCVSKHPKKKRHAKQGRAGR